MSTETSDTKQFWTVRELAENLQVSEKTVIRRVRLGELPQPIHIGKLKRWSVDALWKWVENGCPRTTPDGAQ